VKSCRGANKRAKRLKKGHSGGAPILRTEGGAFGEDGKKKQGGRTSPGGGLKLVNFSIIKAVLQAGGGQTLTRMEGRTSGKCAKKGIRDRIQDTIRQCENAGLVFFGVVDTNAKKPAIKNFQGFVPQDRSGCESEPEGGCWENKNFVSNWGDGKTKSFPYYEWGSSTMFGFNKGISVNGWELHFGVLISPQKKPGPRAPPD